MPPAVAAIGNKILLIFGGESAAATAYAYAAASAIVTVATQLAINASTRTFVPRNPSA